MYFLYNTSKGFVCVLIPVCAHVYVRVCVFAVQKTNLSVVLLTSSTLGFYGAGSPNGLGLTKWVKLAGQ